MQRHLVFGHSARRLTSGRPRGRQAHSLLERLELSKAIPARVAHLELDEQFERRLIRSLLEAVSHLF